jgi:hypothetical protein
MVAVLSWARGAESTDDVEEADGGGIRLAVVGRRRATRLGVE